MRRLHALTWLCPYPRAENGCFVSLPLKGTSGELRRTWHKLIQGTHESWRQPVLEILEYYQRRTPGSFVDDRGLSIVWRYANMNGHGSQGILSGQDSEAAQTDEAPRYENGIGNEAYKWARRQAAEVQNHIMVRVPACTACHGLRLRLRLVVLFPGLSRRAFRASAFSGRNFIPDPSSQGWESHCRRAHSAI